jgi:hypothetical protein
MSGCLIGLIRYAVQGSTPLMIHAIPNSNSSLCFGVFAGRKRSFCADGGCLFLAESSRAVVFELLVECVTVTNGGDVVSFGL